MENKLQELTDKLYNEGLSKGKEEGEALLAKARSQAAEIVAAAEKEAKDIVAKAEKEAADYRTKVSGDLKMAASQSIQATRKDIENLVVFKMTGAATEKVLSGVIWLLIPISSQFMFSRMATYSISGVMIPALA